MKGYRVRKHPTPEGALKQDSGEGRVGGDVVRKHPAPEGALRRDTMTLMTLNLDDRRHLVHQ